MKVRNAHVYKRRQLRHTHKKFPAEMSLKGIIMWDSGIYYGNTGRNTRLIEAVKA